MKASGLLCRASRDNAAAAAAFSADILSPNLYKLHRLFFALLGQAFSDVASLPQADRIVDSLIFSLSLCSRQLRHVNGPGLFRLEKAIEFLIDIAVKLFFHPLFLCLVLFPSWIALLITLIDPGLSADPVCIPGLICSKLLSVAAALIGCKHGIHSKGYADSAGVLGMPADCCPDRYMKLYCALFWIQLHIKLRFVLIVICQRNKNAFPLLFRRNINPPVPITESSLRKGKTEGILCMKLHMAFSHLPAEILLKPLCICLS